VKQAYKSPKWNVQPIERVTNARTQMRGAQTVPNGEFIYAVHRQRGTLVNEFSDVIFDTPPMRPNIASDGIELAG
jgi:hypothetical protein